MCGLGFPFLADGVSDLVATIGRLAQRVIDDRQTLAMLHGILGYDERGHATRS